MYNPCAVLIIKETGNDEGDLDRQEGGNKFLARKMLIFEGVKDAS